MTAVLIILMVVVIAGIAANKKSATRQDHKTASKTENIHEQQ